MRRLLPCISLIALLLVFRFVTAKMELPNFSPLPGFLLCSLIFLRGKYQWVLPAVAWVISNPLMNLYHGYQIGWDDCSSLIGMLVISSLAPWGRRSMSFAHTQMVATAAAILFHFVTNTLAYFVMPMYENSLNGFLQAQWTGPLGMMPTWVFLRNLVAANMMFTAFFMLAIPSFRLTLRPRTILVEG